MRCLSLCGLLILSAVILCPGSARAQSGHDAFDKPLGYDNGREERAAHNYLNRTGTEDVNGDSQIEPNSSNSPSSPYNGARRSGARDQGRQQQARQSDSNDDNAHHHAALGVSLKESDGHVSVIAVMPGSPAAKAGLRVGDQIRYVGEQRIRTAQGLAEEVGEYRPGSQVDLAIRRDGERQTVTATLGSRRAAFGERERLNQNEGSNQQGDSQANRDSQSVRGRTVYSYGPANQQTDQSRQQVNQRVQDLQQQLTRIQQELNNLQSSLRESR